MAESLTPDQLFIIRLTDIILTNLGNENLEVNELAHESGMSLYRLNRRLYSINKKTASQFIREVRLGKALDMLKKEACTIAEVAYKAGFGSPTYFTKSFHDYYGYPPGKLKKGDSNHTELSIPSHYGPGHKIGKSLWMRYILNLPVILLLILISGLAGYSVFRKILIPERREKLLSPGPRISIAVLPVQNMTNDTTWNVWQHWIQFSLISALANTGEVSVRPRELVTSLLRTRGLSEYGSITLTVKDSADADRHIGKYIS